MDEAQGLGSIERLEVNHLLPRQAARPARPARLARMRSGQDERGYPLQAPRDKEQHLPARRIDELQIVERQEHGAVVRHGFHHPDDGLGHAQTDRLGGRVGRCGDAGINSPEPGTHAARLR